MRRIFLYVVLATCVTLTSEYLNVKPDVFCHQNNNFVALIVLIKTQNFNNISQSKIPVPAGFFLIPVIPIPSGTSNSGSGASLMHVLSHYNTSAAELCDLQ